MQVGSRKFLPQVAGRRRKTEDPGNLRTAISARGLTVAIQECTLENRDPSPLEKGIMFQRNQTIQGRKKISDIDIDGTIRVGVECRKVIR